MSEASDKVRGMRELPLFPLPVVLFPGVPLPLHIFEPRYRQMFVSTVSELAIPIKDFDGRIQAVLNIESDRPNAFDSEAREICSALASLVAMVLDRSNSIERESALIEPHHRDVVELRALRRMGRRQRQRRILPTELGEPITGGGDDVLGQRWRGL